MGKTTVMTILVGAAGVFLGQFLYAQYLKSQASS